ncbi:MAG: alpha/beta fold hydrolase [Acidimicrobiia bacterium]
MATVLARYIGNMVSTVSIPWPGGAVSGRLAGAGPLGILLAHGAGTNQDHRVMVALRDRLAAAGHQVLTFNYPYTERGSKSPDRAERLVECHRAAAEVLGEKVDMIFLAGRSMGGRMATYLVAEGYPAAGVVLYAYPLHPPGKPESLRVAHFPEVKLPLLFFQGTRDSLSRMDLFERHIAPLPNATVEILEGATHSLTGGGWSEEAMLKHLTERTASWIAAISSGRTAAIKP